MIHFFLTFSKHAADSPFGRRLQDMGVQSRVIAGEVRHRHRHRAWMMLVGRPRTALFAIGAAWRSLVREQPAPRVVVVWTHIEALIVAVVRWVSGQPDVRIVLVGFILTERRGGLHNWMRERYFKTVFSVVQLVVVHSSVEATRYAQRYAGRAARFVFIPWGSHIQGLDELARAAAAEDMSTGGAADVLCAGRSGRDYPLVYQAFAGTAVRVHIVCDRAQSLDGCVPAPNIQVLDACHGGDYLRQALRARCIVIPLGVGDISAGQMVLLQAMQMGKAVVITRTSTTTDYATDGHDVLFVEPGDADGLRAAVQRLLSDPVLQARLTANAKRSFNEKFTIPAFVTSLVHEIQLMDPGAGRAAP